MSYTLKAFDGTNGSTTLRDEVEAYAIGTFLLGKQAIDFITK